MSDMKNSPFETTPRRRILSIAIALLGVLISAFVGSIVTNYFNRARPHLELVSIAFRGSALPAHKIRTTPTLFQAYEAVPYVFGDFSDAMTLQELDSVIADADDYNKILPIAKSVVSDVIRELESSPRDANKDRLRSKLIQRWSEVPGNALEAILKGVLFQKGYVTKLLSDEAYSKYREHPAEDRWAKPETARVMTSGTSWHNLAEERELPTDNSRVESEKIVTNLIRRLWIYLDRDLYTEILEHVSSSVASITVLTEDFVKLLAEYRATLNPERIHATVVISNLGLTPMVFRSFGLLQITTASSTAKIEMDARVEDKVTDVGTIVVPANGSITVEWYSRQLAKDVSISFGGSKEALQALYDSEVLKCSFATYRIKSGGETGVMRTKGSVQFGSDVNKRLREDLVRALE